MAKKSKIREYIEALVTAALIAFVIRSFVIEPFKIPSSSMIPTLLIGDHIFVNKFIYGLRIPFTKVRFFEFSKPKRGEPIVFIYPVDESKDFIKRVVGIEGDRIKIDGSDVWINGANLQKRPIQGSNDRVDLFEEELDGTTHTVQYDRTPYHFTGHFMYEHAGEIVVPEGHLFVMGDNRDNSADGREWGFVPIANVKGKAMFVWLSLGSNEKGWIRWKRFGRWIY